MIAAIVQLEHDLDRSQDAHQRVKVDQDLTPRSETTVEPRSVERGRSTAALRGGSLRHVPQVKKLGAGSSGGVKTYFLTYRYLGSCIYLRLLLSGLSQAPNRGWIAVQNLRQRASGKLVC